MKIRHPKFKNLKQTLQPDLEPTTSHTELYQKTE